MTAGASRTASFHEDAWSTPDIGWARPGEDAPPLAGIALGVDFTAIGDTVNLAARIEAMTKQLEAPIVVSDATRASVAATTPRAGLAFAPLGAVVARGRTEPTIVHALGSPQDKAAAQAA